MRFRLIFGTLAVVAGMILGAHGARAHATLLGSMPADGSVIATSPPAGALRFSEPVRPALLRLIGPDGASIDLQPRAGGAQVDFTVPPLAQGTHVLSWRAVSSDGHPVGGAVTFSIGTAGATKAADAQQVTGLVVATWFARMLVYLGLLFGSGTVLAMGWLAPGAVWPPAIGRFASGMLLAGAAGGILGLGTAGLDLTGLDWPALASLRPWREAAATSLGPSSAVFLLGLAASALALAAIAAPASRALALIGAVLVAGSFAATGHAVNAGPEWLTRPAIALHAFAAQAWAGSLPVLFVLARSDPARFQRALTRFSATALWTVALLAGAGIVLATLQVGDVQALSETAYGRVLCLKLVAVAGLLALAGWNRLRLTNRALAGQPSGTLTLRRVVAVEMALMIAVAGIVGLWRFTPPPRALAAQEAVRGHMHLHGTEAMADMAFRPGRVGENTVEIVVMGPDFGELVPQDVTVIIGNPAAGIEPAERKAERLPDGRWRATGLVFPVRGIWTVRVDVLIDDFQKVMLEGEFSPPP